MKLYFNSEVPHINVAMSAETLNDATVLPKRLVDYVYKRYYNADPAHGKPHIEKVRMEARNIAESINFQELLLLDAAALLHDIGRAVDNERHEVVGARLLKNDAKIAEYFDKHQIKQLAHAVVNHRASTGQPETTLAKVLSDADRLGAENHIKRAYEYNRHYGQQITAITIDDNMSAIQALMHIAHKYGPGGRGTRTYYPYTAKILKQRITPIVHLNNKLLEIIPKIRKLMEL